MLLSDNLASKCDVMGMKGAVLKTTFVPWNTRSRPAVSTIRFLLESTENWGWLYPLTSRQTWLGFTGIVGKGGTKTQYRDRPWLVAAQVR